MLGDLILVVSGLLPYLPLPWAVQVLRTTLASFLGEGVLHSPHWLPCPSLWAGVTQHCYVCAPLGHQIVAKAETLGPGSPHPHTHTAVSLGALLSSCHAPRTLDPASHGTPGPPSSCSEATPSQLGVGLCSLLNRCVESSA